MSCDCKKELTCETILHVTDDADNGTLPVYQTKEAACADVCCPSDVYIPPHSSYRIDSLVSFKIPKGYKIIMYPRSSLLIKKGLIQPVSIIDADYHGHVHVPLFNILDVPVHIERGERIAQIELVPSYNCTNWPRKQEERTGGFGSTGTGTSSPSVVIPASDESTSLHN